MAISAPTRNKSKRLNTTYGDATGSECDWKHKLIWGLHMLRVSYLSFALLFPTSLDHLRPLSYLRLEVLEGLVSYHRGDSRAVVDASFRAAQAKWRRLQVGNTYYLQLRVFGALLGA